jgi:uncharacterized membrane protein
MKDLFLGHPRLWIACIAGGLLFFLLPHDWSILSRVLLCWNGGVILFLTLIFLWARRLTAAQICTKYIEEDETAPFILVVVIIAAVASLFAIVEPLATIKQVSGSVRAAHFALAALTLIDSWLLVPTMYTTHYADMFYSAASDDRPLRFPNTPEPVFWDFAYFSFTIAAACQTADVATEHADIRRVVIGQTLISFLFNASILGFAINVTAGLIGGS